MTLGATRDHGRTGRVLGERYTVLQRVGESALATTYAAEDEETGEQVLVKMPQEDLARVEGFVPALTQRASVLLRIKHPSVVKVLGVGFEGDAPYVVVRPVEGESLLSQLRRIQRVHTPSELRRWLVDVAGALDFMHGKGFLHLEVKPGNVLLRREGEAFLSDVVFGAALGTLPASVASAWTARSSPEFSAPEVRRGGSPSPRADQYSLAAVACWALGVPRQVVRVSSPVTLRAQGVSPRAAEPLARALSEEPEERFSFCFEFAHAVAEAEADAAEENVEAARALPPAHLSEERVEIGVGPRRRPGHAEGDSPRLPEGEESTLEDLEADGDVPAPPARAPSRALSGTSPRRRRRRRPRPGSRS